MKTRSNCVWTKCDFCYIDAEKLYPYAMPLTTDTVFLCRGCIEEELSMTVEELGYEKQTALEQFRHLGNMWRELVRSATPYWIVRLLDWLIGDRNDQE